jgi:hypothetical protein
MISARATLKRATAVAAALALAGCGQPQNALTGGTGYGIAAEDLDKTLVSRDALTAENGKDDKAFYVGLIVQDSATKCGTFVKKLVAAETGTDTALDLLATTFSALGTAFTPIATIHALNAAGTIASGSKAAIDSDIYAKASVANFIQAIQSTYYKDLQSYWNNFEAAPNNPPVNLPGEVMKIMDVHAECSLASAQAAISATLKGSSTAGKTDDNGANPPADEAPKPPAKAPAKAPAKTPAKAEAKAEPPAPAPAQEPKRSTQIFVPGHAVQ